MKVLVAGATGIVGSRLVPKLLERGHIVVGTTRHKAKLPRLHALGAEGMVLDGLDAAAVSEAVAGTRPEAIINQMTALSGTPDFRRFDRWFAATNELRISGTRNLRDAARAFGVPTLITQSYAGWNMDDSGGLVKTEDDPLDPDPVPAQRQALAAIEQMEADVLAAPLDGIVLRYANLYGPGAIDDSLELLHRRRFPIVGDGAGVWSWVHLDDAASATVAALERGIPGIFNVADDEPAPVREWLPYLAEVVGAPPPSRVPAWLGRLLAGEAAVRSMTRGRGASNDKAKAMLGWQPRWTSWRDGFLTLRGNALDSPPRRDDHRARDARSAVSS